MISETPDISSWNIIAQCIWNYKSEAEFSRRNREIQNRLNFEIFNLRQDYSHKKRGQSKEFLDKQSKSVDQLSAFLQQGLMDVGSWFRVYLKEGVDPSKQKIDPQTAQKLLLDQLDKNKFPNFFNDCLKYGLLGSLMIVKVGGEEVDRSEFEARPEMFGLTGRRKLIRKDKKVWELRLNLVRQEDYFPDPNINPNNKRLYELQRIEMDYHDLLKLAEAYPDDFDIDAVRRIAPSIDELQKAKKARETGQNVTYNIYRRRVTIFECWGTLIERGTGKIIMENCVSAIDMQGNVIRPPKKNPYWHGKSPFVTSPIIRVPNSVWHRALMDAPTRHNVSLNELYNLMVDAAMMEVHGIKQLHGSWMENPDQASEGIAPGTTILANNSCPPGAKVLERVDTSALTAQAVQMFQLINNEYQASALTNDTRLGSLPSREVKATEIVASNQSLTGVMNGIVKVIEEEFVEPLLERCWLTMCQHMNDLDSKDVQALVGNQQSAIISNMSQEELFAETVTGHKYKVFGLSTTLNKIQDFRKITSLLQSIGSSPMMMQEFMRKYSMTKLLGEIVKSLDIDEEKITMDQNEAKQHQMEAQMMQQQQQQEAMGNTQGGEGTNPQSQIPQMSAQETGNEGNLAMRHAGMNNIGMTNPQ